MAIVMTKPKLQPKPAEPELSEFANLIDNLGNLSVEAARITARIKVEQERLKPYQEAMKELQAKIEALPLPADLVFTELGTTYKVEIGKRGSSRSIKDMALVKVLMGNDLFMKVATVTLKAIDDYLTQPQREQVIETSRSGRSLSIIRRV